MSTEPKTIRTRLQTPIVLILTHIVLPSIAIAAIAFLLWTQPIASHENVSLIMRYLPIVFSAIVIAIGVLNLRSQKRAILFTSLSGLSALLALLFCFLSKALDQLFELNLLWDIPFFLISLITFSLLVPFTVSLWYLIATPIKDNVTPLADFGITLSSMLLLFFVAPICALILDALRIYHDAVWITGIVGFCVLLLAGAFHILWIFGCTLSRKVKVHPVTKRILLLLATVVLPVAGLLLNRGIPFPGDLQSPWCYLLTLLTAITLLLPDGSGFKGRLLAFFRWFTLPFTLYFFILFLPFMPLALPAMIVIGAGFLLLAPTILLAIHLPALCRSAKCFTTRWAHWGIALLGFVIIPAIIITTIERDRGFVRPLIAAIATPDTTAATDTLPIPEPVAKRIAQLLLSRDYSTRSFPMISHWADYRLFNGLYPRTEVLESLAKRLDLTNPGSRKRFSWRRIRSQQVPVTTTLRGVGTSQLTVAITIPAIENAEEFSAPIRLSDGVWITGLRLKMPQKGPWRDGLLCDRRAATWIYERLTERNIDPALLTLDTLTQGTLRVSPVTEVREVEIDLLMPNPTWCDTPITIGEQTVQLPGGEPIVTPEIPTATVCFVGPHASLPLPEANLYVVATPMISVTETAPTVLPTSGQVDVERAFRFACGNAYAKNLCLSKAIFVGDGWEKATFTPMTPKRPLPKLAPDEPWQHGAIAAQLSEARLYAPHPEYDEPLREALQKSKALMPNYAYIVVETEAQERALRTLDAVAKQAAAGVDFETPNTVKQSTPSFICLLLLFSVVLFFRNRKTYQRGES